ncbi:MAG: hypothetical protein OXH85_03145 [Truepera sp.]|nr:hypothetical protein [Truepera sp.]
MRSGVPGRCLHSIDLGPGRRDLLTGRLIALWDIGHHEVEWRRIVREYTAYDEFALLGQIHRLGTGGVGT